MSSYRPFPPPLPRSDFGPTIPPPPNQTALPPPPLAPTPQPRGNLYSQNWNYPSSSFQSGGYTAPPINPVPNQQQPYSSYPPPPPPETTYPPPPPPSQTTTPGQTYFLSSQYPQFNNQSLPPPPPPSSPPSSSIPPPPPPPPSQLSSPPPPPSSVPVTNQTKEHRQSDYKRPSKESAVAHSHHKVPSKQHAKPSALPPMPARTSNRVETEEERKARKKREMERQRQDEKHRQQLKESQNKILQKTQMLSSAIKPHGSISGSHMGERRATPFLSGERAENRLKKPTTFLCKLKFRDELPDLIAQPKLLSLRRDKDRAAKYTITSLENMHKPQLYVEPDLGIPLNLLDLSAYNAPKGEMLHLAPEDEKLLHEDVSVTPIKKDGLKRKERPTDTGMSWLVKTQYISSLSTDAARQSLTEKQAKELRETRGRDMPDGLNSREKKIQDIESSFEACKSHPVHATNRKLQPVEVLPLFPDFERWNDQFVVATFDGAPTADSESYNKMEKSVRDAHESQAIMKSFVASTSSSAKPDKFLAYMVPAVGELSKDVYDENEDISYTWVREYHWDVRGEDADDPTNYLVAFGESEARYMPLPTKLMLRKKRAKEGKSSEEIEHFPVPASITVRQRSKVLVEMRESEDYAGSKGRSSNSRHQGQMDSEDQQQKGIRDDDDGGDIDQSSGADDLSD